MNNSNPKPPKTDNSRQDQSKISSLTQENATESGAGTQNQKNTFQPPTINLPKGGGAIQGIGEKFQVNPVTGTGAMSVPIAMSPGRSGFTPQLALSYDSGAGNSPFGLGWNVGLPNISRKTQAGLPQYDGLPKYYDRDESDVFLLSGAEDLVPLLKDDGSRFEDSSHPGFTIYRYIPRIEGLFARIEKWVADDGAIHWRSISKENVTSIYGPDTDSQIHHPDDSQKVLRWLLERSFDDKGNVMVYEYKKEDGEEPPPASNPLFEKNRNTYAQKYLKRIKYGNTLPYLKRQDSFDEADWEATNEWLFELVFDYGEHLLPGETIPAYDEQQRWPVRPDIFSSFRAGFDIRTYRLCRRILMFHHIPQLSPQPYLVKSTQLELEESPIATQLQSVTHSGYRKDDTGNYVSKSFPPVTFGYTVQKIDETIYSIHSEDLPNVPQGIDGQFYQFNDLYGEGLNGILKQDARAWYFKRNLGDGQFGPLQAVAEMPSLAINANVQVTDFGGDGLTDVVVQTDNLNGYFELSEEEEWSAFRPFAHPLNFNVNNPSQRMIDLDGNGIPDLLITENDCLVWFPADARDGYKASRRVAKVLDEESGPRIVFNEAFQTIFLADMSGDGLTDIVRIRNGEACYWANMGYGQFSAKITMAQAPQFDHPDYFDPARIRLADIDGSGVTDILYLGRDNIRYWLNQSGNSFSSTFTIEHFPKTTNLHTVSVFDLLGNGTACIVWASPLPAEANTPMKYIKLMGDTHLEGNKPYLLKEVNNNMGAITRLKYKASTKFYLEDRQQGHPWITKLPFPVQVLVRQEVYDEIAGNHFVSGYAYHHGYFDHVEREFRGFGMVEQWDTEDYETFSQNTLFDIPGRNWQEEVDIMPPIYTKTWFHTGYYRPEGKITRQYEREYYDGDPDAWLLEDTSFPEGLKAQEQREAARAIKGRPLRVEVYGLDNAEVFSIPEDDISEPVGSSLPQAWRDAFSDHIPSFQTDTIEVEKEDDAHWLIKNLTTDKHYQIELKDDYFSIDDLAIVELTRHPYTVAETKYHIKTIQPKDDNRHASFYVCECESLSYQYERNPADPRISHQSTLEIDKFGNVQKSAAIVYDRREDFVLHPEQEEIIVNYSEADFINKDAEADFYRIGVPYAQRTFEIHGLSLTAPYDKETLRLAIAGATDLSFEEAPSSGVEKRLLSASKSSFYKEDLSGELAFGEIDFHALPYRSYEAVYTQGLIDRFEKDGVELIDAADIETEAGFLPIDNLWWRHSGRAIFDPAQFYFPIQQSDPFGHTYEMGYDAYRLAMTHTSTQVSGKTVASSAKMDYRTLQPYQLTDLNGNQTEALFDEVGMVIASAVKGKNGEGDGLAGYTYTPYPNQDMRAIMYADPHAYLQGATSFFFYDLNAWRRDGIPNHALAIVRETHADAASKTQISFSYSDGFGQTIMAKVQAEPGNAFRLDSGSVVEDHADPRWLGNGRTVFNNKGNPVKQYEPYFSHTYDYEAESELVEYGVTPVLHYDPLGRNIRTDLPDGTFTKVEFTPWLQRTFDQNDTVLNSDWYAEKISSSNPYEQRAAQLAAGHADTPKVEHFDTLGRIFLMEDDNGAEGIYQTRFKLDISGNQIEVTDAKMRLITRNVFNMAGEQIHTASMDGGRRWSLPNIMGNPLYLWNDRNFRSRSAYDELQRPTGTFVSENGASEEHVYKMVYGEALADPAALNHFGQVWKLYDQSGVMISDAFDFKGNLLRGSRQVAEDYKNRLDWSAASPPVLESEVFQTSTQYDALNRPIQAIAPDDSETIYTYNEANFVEKIQTRLRGASTLTDFVENIDYDAKGQRTRIQYGNNVTTTYEYDPKTFRLIHLRSTRNTGTNPLQDLTYYFDPVGNITDIRDDAQPTIFYANQMIEAHGSYTYDALYRLIEAKGREQIGQAGQPHDPKHDYIVSGDINPNDGQAMRCYRRKYLYDELGNIQQVNHRTANDCSNYQSNWTRKYRYDEDSLLDGAHKSNRLTATTLDDWTTTMPYTHDLHGNMTSMPHLFAMIWDFADQLKEVDLGGGGREYYTYTMGGGKDFGVRARKVTEKAGGKICDRIYIGDFEIYRERKSSGAIELERETLHLQDDAGRIALVDTLTIENGAPKTANNQTIRYQLSNHLGSATLELDQQADLISYEEYYPFGASSYRAGRSSAEVSLKRYRYVGKERDESTGLDYYGARYYGSWFCRFVSVDGLKDKYPFYTTYQYAGNKPVTFIDLDGLEEAQGSGENDIYPLLGWLFDLMGWHNTNSQSESAYNWMQEHSYHNPNDPGPMISPMQAEQILWNSTADQHNMLFKSMAEAATEEFVFNMAEEAVLARIPLIGRAASRTITRVKKSTKVGQAVSKTVTKSTTSKTSKAVTESGTSTTSTKKPTDNPSSAKKKSSINDPSKKSSNPYDDVADQVKKNIDPELYGHLESTQFSAHQRDIFTTIESSSYKNGVYQFNIHSLKISRKFKGIKRSPKESLENLKKLYQSFIDEARGAGAKRVEINALESRKGFKKLMEYQGFKVKEYEKGTKMGYTFVKDL